MVATNASQKGIYAFCFREAGFCLIKHDTFVFKKALQTTLRSSYSPMGRRDLGSAERSACEPFYGSKKGGQVVCWGRKIWFCRGIRGFSFPCEKGVLSDKLHATRRY